MRNLWGSYFFLHYRFRHRFTMPELILGRVAESLMVLSVETTGAAFDIFRFLLGTFSTFFEVFGDPLVRCGNPAVTLFRPDLQLPIIGIAEHVHKDGNAHHRADCGEHQKQAHPLRVSSQRLNGKSAAYEHEQEDRRPLPESSEPLFPFHPYRPSLSWVPRPAYHNVANLSTGVTVGV